MPYDIPNLDVTLHTVATGVPVLWWRSVGHSHTGFVVETMVDAGASRWAASAHAATLAAVRRRCGDNTTYSFVAGAGRST